MPKKKDGEIISWKEWFKLWKFGILNLTPQQKISNEFNSTIVILVGFLVALTSLIIFRDKLIVSWFAYGLILIFAGNTWGTIIKLIGMYQQKKFFKNLENQLKEADEENEDNEDDEMYAKEEVEEVKVNEEEKTEKLPIETAEKHDREIKDKNEEEKKNE